MREYELTIDEALKNGLTPEHITPFNTQVLFECLGFRCGKLGLEAYIELTNPLPAALNIRYSWPFPQYLTGEAYNILIVRDSFLIVDYVYLISDDHLTTSLIHVVDALTYGQGTLMELADFGEYAFMTNGVVMIYWDTTLAAWQTVTSLPNVPMMRTICNFKGQAIGGNVVSAWYDCDETFYTWSKIGEMDFTPDRRNESGYRRCPYGGEVYHVRRFGDNVIGYSSKGITLINPVASPAATFGFSEMSDIGLLNRGAMDGDLRRQVYVGEDYIVRGISGKNEIEELGYQQYMEELGSTEPIIVSYDPSEKNFYIGNSTKTFLLSTFGLTEIQQHPSTVWRRDKESYMLPDAVDDFEPLITTEAFDMEYKGQKTTATIETDAMSHIGPQASVDWATNLNDWNVTGYIPINDQGIATIAVASNFFRFKLKFTSIESDFRISYIKSRYKMTDLRGIRGVYAPPLRGQ